MITVELRLRLVRGQAVLTSLIWVRLVLRAWCSSITACNYQPLEKVEKGVRFPSFTRGTNIIKIKS